MSTDARRASIPPRPTTPPLPAVPPHGADPAGGPVPAPDVPEEHPSAAPPATGTPSHPGPPAGSSPHPPSHPPVAGTPVSPPRPAGAPAGPDAAPPAAQAPARSGHQPTQPHFRDFPRSPAPDGAPGTPPPPAASARFPDTQPPASAGATAPASRPGVPPHDLPVAPAAPAEGRGSERPARPATPPGPLPADRPADGRTPQPDYVRYTAEALDLLVPNPHRPWVTLAQPDIRHPETYGDGRRPRPGRARAVTAAACVVLGLGLIGGALAGSWLAGDSDGDGDRGGFAAAGQLWHSVPVDKLFPPTVEGEGAGPGGTDRTWTRIAVAPDSGCADAFDPLLRKALAPVGCGRLLRATYTDATSSNVITVGLLFTKADSAAMTSLKARFRKEGLGRRTDLMPRPYAAEGTVAAGFGDRQRASWSLSVLTDAPVVVYAVSGFADGRTVTEPQPAEEAMKSGATTTPAQSGLGHEARGLADRIERGLRKTVSGAEKYS